MSHSFAQNESNRSTLEDHEKSVGEIAAAALEDGPELVNPDFEQNHVHEISSFRIAKPKTVQSSQPLPSEQVPTAKARSRKSDRLYRWTLCDAEKAQQKLASAVSARQHDRTRFMEDLCQRTTRTLPRVTVSMIDGVAALSENYPNFEHVVSYICRKLKLCRLLKQPVYIPPLLLSGPPGVGKTQFIKTLAEVVSGSFTFMNMGETTAGFMLTGSGQGWANSTIGTVARSIVEAPDGSVVMILLDELDKTLTNSNYPADRSLLSLLESHTASHFRDESVEIDFDARPVCWFLTCNNIEAVRPEIVSRVHHLEVSVPTKSQMPRVVRSIDAGLRQRSPSMSRVFEPLDDSVTRELSALPPRIVARVLDEAYGRVAEAATTVSGRLRVSPAIIRESQAAIHAVGDSARPMGFL